jgi:hypothetical protein
VAYGSFPVEDDFFAAEQRRGVGEQDFLLGEQDFGVGEQDFLMGEQDFSLGEQRNFNGLRDICTRAAQGSAEVSGRGLVRQAS